MLCLALIDRNMRAETDYVCLISGDLPRGRLSGTFQALACVAMKRVVKNVIAAHTGYTESPFVVITYGTCAHNYMFMVRAPERDAFAEVLDTRNVRSIATILFTQAAATSEQSLINTFNLHRIKDDT